MSRIDRLFVLLGLLVAAPVAGAFECWRAEVGPKSVAHLKGAAELFFLAPSQSGEVGQMVVTNATIHARSAVHWKMTQPVRYKFDALPGEFFRGALVGGGTTLESRRGPFALAADGQRLVILVEPGAATTYEIKPLGDLECAKVFPNARRSIDLDDEHD